MLCNLLINSFEIIFNLCWTCSIQIICFYYNIICVHILLILESFYVRKMLTIISSFFVRGFAAMWSQPCRFKLGLKVKCKNCLQNNNNILSFPFLLYCLLMFVSSHIVLKEFPFLQIREMQNQMSAQKLFSEKERKT